MSIHTAAAASALPRLPVSWKEFGELLRSSQAPPKLPPKQEPIAKVEAYDKTRVFDDSKDSDWSSKSDDNSDSRDMLDLSQDALPRFAEHPETEPPHSPESGLAEPLKAEPQEVKADTTHEQATREANNPPPPQFADIMTVDSLDLFA